MRFHSCGNSSSRHSFTIFILQSLLWHPAAPQSIVISIFLKFFFTDLRSLSWCLLWSWQLSVYGGVGLQSSHTSFCFFVVKLFDFVFWSYCTSHLVICMNIFEQKWVISPKLGVQQGLLSIEDMIWFNTGVNLILWAGVLRLISLATLPFVLGTQWNTHSTSKRGVSGNVTTSYRLSTLHDFLGFPQSGIDVSLCFSILFQSSLESPLFSICLYQSPLSFFIYCQLSRFAPIVPFDALFWKIHFPVYCYTKGLIAVTACCAGN